MAAINDDYLFFQLLYPKTEAVEEWDYLEERVPSPLGKFKKMGTIYITSYETGASLTPMLKTVTWSYIVVDEGHRLKNSKTNLFVQLKKIPSKHRLLLTGTPLQNNMGELWSLLNFLQPDLFHDYQIFEVSCSVNPHFLPI